MNELQNLVERNISRDIHNLHCEIAHLQGSIQANNICVLKRLKRIENFLEQLTEHKQDDICDSEKSPR